MRPKIFIKTNFDLCSGCELCCLACSEKFFNGYNPHLSAIRIDHGEENLYHFPVVCQQCDNPYCANVCPKKAIERDPQTGALVVNPDECIGCNLCNRYCPIDMAGVGPEVNYSIKCDLCNGAPKCVDACPTGALETISL